MDCKRVTTYQARPSKGAYLVLLVSALLVVGCTIRLIGDYDDTFDQGITAVQQKSETYFAKLQSTPTTPFDQGFYDGIKVDLAVLKTRAESLPKYSILAAQVGSLSSQFDTLRKLDESAKRPVSVAMVNDGQQAIETSVRAILTLELALKSRVSTPATPSTPAPKKTAGT